MLSGIGLSKRHLHNVRSASTSALSASITRFHHLIKQPVTNGAAQPQRENSTSAEDKEPKAQGQSQGQSLHLAKLIHRDPRQPHFSLATFVDHARRANLTPTSTTYLGTRYEYLTLEHLTRHLKFDLVRTGRRDDKGIDLLGTWPLPAILRAQTIKAQPQPQLQTQSQSLVDDSINVFIQCKRLRRVSASAKGTSNNSGSRGGPKLIRELEGSFHSLPSTFRNPNSNTLGILVCTHPATKGIREAMSVSSRGLAWVTLEEEQEDEGGGDDLTPPQTRIHQFLYNAPAAERCSLEGVSVGLKHVVQEFPQHRNGQDVKTKGSDTRTRTVKEVQLLWMGKPIDFGLV